MFDKFFQWIDRAKSRVYTIYIFWLGMLFSPVIFTSVFTDQELIFKKTGLLKNEYVFQTYFGSGDVYGISYLALAFLGAGFMTWLAIWKFPDWFVNRSHEKEADSQTKRDIYQLKKEREVEKEKTNLADQQVETTKALVEIVEQKEELESKEDNLWRQDYTRFKRSRYFSLFTDVKDCLYRFSGRTYVSDDYDRTVFELSSDISAYLDANNLAEIRQGELSLTEKGRFFMKRFLEDTPTVNG